MSNNVASWIERLPDGVSVNGRYHTSFDLGLETADLALGALDGILYEKAMKHIILPKRSYFIKTKNGSQYLMYRNSKGDEKEIQVLGYQASTENTLDREIVTIIKGKNDDIFPEHDAVKVLRDLIIRVAATDNIRIYLGSLEEQIGGIGKNLALAEEKSRARKMGDLSVGWRNAAEGRAERFFTAFMELSGATESELRAIHWLSWAWKNPESYGKYKYMAWSWVIIICIYGLVKTGK